MILGIDFSEIILIGLLALVVLGPDKLIKVATIAGKLVGKLQSNLANIKFALNSNQELAELKNKLHEIKQMSSLNSIIDKEHGQSTEGYSNCNVTDNILESKKLGSQQAVNTQDNLPIQQVSAQAVTNNASVKYHQPELNLGEQPELFD